MRKKSIQKEELLRIALRVFSRYGYKKTTLADIADEVNMTKANLYNYVESKERLYHQAVVHALDDWRAAVEKKVISLTSPVERFQGMVREAFVYIEHNQELQQLIMQDRRILTISSATDQFGVVNRQSWGMLNAVIEEGIELGMFYDVQADLVTEYLYSTYMMFLMKRYVIKEGERTSKVFEQSLQLITRGLIKPEYLKERAHS